MSVVVEISQQIQEVSVEISDANQDISVEIQNTSQEVTVEVNASSSNDGSLPSGGRKRSLLTKLSNSDGDQNWRVGFFDLIFAIEYTGQTTTLTNGVVDECSIDGGTIYRYVDNRNNSRGYSIEDSFYENFDGTTLTGLIVTRG